MSYNSLEHGPGLHELKQNEQLVLMRQVVLVLNPQHEFAVIGLWFRQNKITAHT